VKKAKRKHTLRTDPPSSDVKRRSTPPDIFFILFSTAAVIFTLLRFVNITADVPVGTEMSGVFYTDEGWYCNGAINLRQFGKWYCDGDFNPAVNLPVHHLIQSVAFSIFGMSLQTARSVTAFCFVMIIVILFFTIRSYSGNRTAALTAMMLSSNLLFLTYSRIAILELPMLFFVTAGVGLSLSFKKANDYPVIAVSAILLATAALTKTTALFGLPVLLYCTSLRGGSLQKKILLALTAVSTFVIPVVVWNHFAASLHPNDFALFTKVNFADRMQLNPATVARSIIDIFIKLLRNDPVFVPPALLLSLFLLIRNQGFRKNVLVHISLIWFVSGLAILATTSYHPLRYLTALEIPVMIILGFALFTFDTLLPKGIGAAVIAIAALIFSGIGAAGIMRTITTPHYSFITMAREVRRIADREDAGSIVMGNFANSVSLAGGIRSINTSGTQSVEWKIKQYHPKFYLSLGYEPEMIREIFKYHVLTPAGEWNVFDNYISDKPVYLFRLDRHDSP